ALGEGAVVDVHAEEDPAARDQGRRLDLVALAREAAESRRIDATGAGVEVPRLDARARIDRVHGLLCGDEDPLLSGDDTHIDRAHVGIPGAPRVAKAEAPHLAAVVETQRVERVRPRLHE